MTTSPQALGKRIDELVIAIHQLEKQQEAQQRCILRQDAEIISLRDQVHRLSTRGCDE